MNWRGLLLMLCWLLPYFKLPVQAQPCKGQLSCTVLGPDGKAVAGARVMLAPLQHSNYTDSLGRCGFAGLCAGNYRLITTADGYGPDNQRVQLKLARTAIVVGLTSKELILEALQVQANGLTTPLATQPVGVLQGNALARTRGQTLGEALQQLPGVTALQSGPSVYKPMINGLTGNRVLVLNNGIRQEGQQWGSEHAPEIDPFTAYRLSVIKGAASVRYGPDALGGVVLVDPKPLLVQPGWGGELNLVGASNSWMGASAGQLEAAAGGKLLGLAARLQGTLRRGGDFSTPRYLLANTAYGERNYSATLVYRRHQWDAELYFSEFFTQLGIYSGSVVASLADLKLALARGGPAVPAGSFSYEINRPYQQVLHQLFKARFNLTLGATSQLSLLVARQQNKRYEYDFIPFNGSPDPELYLKITTHTADLLLQHSKGNFSSQLGASFSTQGNVQGGFFLLIPNFRNYGGGAFWIGKYVQGKWLLEAGLRYDYRWLRAYLRDIVHPTFIQTPTHQWQRPTVALGAKYFFSPRLSLAANLASAWRAPSMNELYSDGLHQSAASIEYGAAFNHQLNYYDYSKTLRAEQAYNSQLTLNYAAKQLTAELTMYANYIYGYIFLKPDSLPVQTIRGVFPSFTYTQVATRWLGLNASLSWVPLPRWQLSAQASYLAAYNLSLHNYLQLVPANRLRTALTYTAVGTQVLKKPYATLSVQAVDRQQRVPANSDYAPPPAGYALVGAELGCTLQLGPQPLQLSVVVSNLANQVYRDYLDRFRYYNDALGRNYQLRLALQLGKQRAAA